MLTDRIFYGYGKKWDSMYPDYQYEVRKFDDIIYTDTRISNGNIKLDTDGISYLPVNENKDYPQDVAYPYDPYTGTSFRASVKGFNADNQWMCGKYMSSSEYKVNDSDDNWYILRLQTYCCYWQKQKRISVTGSCHKAF